MPTLDLSPTADGYVGRSGANEAFSALRNGAGTLVNLGAATAPLYLYEAGDPDTWQELRRGIYSFNTSLIPAGATITGASLFLFATSKADGNGYAAQGFAYNIYGATPASPTSLVAADYGQCQAVAFSSPVGYASISTSVITEWVLNAAGLAALNVAGSTSFSVRNNFDATNVAPTYTVNMSPSYITTATQENGTVPRRPILRITYTGGGVAAQDLTAGLLTSTPTLYAPTGAAGAVAVSVALLDSTPSLTAPVLSSRVSMVAPLLSVAAALYAPTSTGRSYVTAPLLDAGAVLYGGTFAGTIPSQTLAAGLLSTTPVVLSPVVGNVTTAALPMLISTATMFVPGLVDGARLLQPASLDSESRLYDVTLIDGRAYLADELAYRIIKDEFWPNPYRQQQVDPLHQRHYVKDD